MGTIIDLALLILAAPLRRLTEFIVTNAEGMTAYRLAVCAAVFLLVFIGFFRLVYINDVKRREAKKESGREKIK